MRALISAALIAACTVSHAAELPRDILGLRLGEPLTASPCKDTGDDWLADVGDEPCVRPLVGTPGNNSLQGSVVFENHPAPSWVRTVMGTVRDGRLTSVTLTTHGEMIQTVAHEALAEKFGKPHVYEVSTRRNGLGQEFESIDAMWTDGDLVVDLSGISDRRDRGHVIIHTAAERQAIERVHAEQRAREPRL